MSISFTNPAMSGTLNLSAPIPTITKEPPGLVAYERINFTRSYKNCVNFDLSR